VTAIVVYGNDVVITGSLITTARLAEKAYKDAKKTKSVSDRSIFTTFGVTAFGW
jgi:hypothetical protein